MHLDMDQRIYTTNKLTWYHNRRLFHILFCNLVLYRTVNLHNPKDRNTLQRCLFHGIRRWDHTVTVSKVMLVVYVL